MNVSPVTLTGKTVRLEPLSLAHVPDLILVGQDESIWQYMRYGAVRTELDIRRWVEERLAEQQAGTDLPFAVIHLQEQVAIGSTRYLEIRPVHRALEIGGTWYGVRYQRTRVNTECKYLLLRHAFESLGCVRVQFKTDARNLRSQKAIERIGAVREGLLRNHMLLPGGGLRHSVYYSIIDEEWLSVKAHLESLLAQHPEE